MIQMSAAGAAGVILTLPGCGSSDRPGSDGAAVGAVLEELTFSDDDAFYQKLEEALQDDRKVAVRFEGALITEDSRFLSWIQGAVNHKSILADLDQRDTKEGRAELAKVFATEMLKRREAQTTVETTDRVIEPGTIALVAILAIAAVTAYAMSRKYKGRFYAGRGGFGFEFEPA
jgi:hypothetical protein